jgi:hypothetical protein
MLFQTHHCKARRDSDEKLFRPQEQSCVPYYPIWTKRALVMEKWEGVPCVMFESHGCNVRRDTKEKLFRPQELSALHY